MELKPLSATNDFVFRKMFSENIAILKAFLMTVLDLPAEEYKSLEVIDPNLGREFIYGPALMSRKSIFGFYVVRLQTYMRRQSYG